MLWWPSRCDAKKKIEWLLLLIRHFPSQQHSHIIYIWYNHSHLVHMQLYSTLYTNDKTRKPKKHFNFSSLWRSRSRCWVCVEVEKYINIIITKPESAQRQREMESKKTREFLIASVHFVHKNIHNFRFQTQRSEGEEEEDCAQYSQCVSMSQCTTKHSRVACWVSSVSLSFIFFRYNIF